MKKLLLPVLLFTLVACGAPDPEIIEVEVIKEVVEVEVIKEVVVTATALPPAPIVEYGVLYLVTKQSTRLWTGSLDANGDMVFEKYKPELRYNADEIVTGYNGRGEGLEAEFYLNDGNLALGSASFPNAQEFDNDGVAEFAGRWSGEWIDADGNLRAEVRYFYKVAGPFGPGLFVMADHVELASCETDPVTGELIYLILTIPESCQQ